MNDIKTLLQQYEEINAELNKRIAENGKVFLEQVFQEIFDRHEGLNVVCIVGYTPSFNDGDPCTHNQYTFVGNTSTWGSIDFVDEIGNFEDDFEYDEEEGTHLNSNCKTLSDVESQVAAYDEIFERVYDTNYRIVVTKDETGKVSVNCDEYYCGY